MNFFQLQESGPPVCTLSPNDSTAWLREKRQWLNAGDRLAHFADAGPADGTVHEDGLDWYDFLGCLTGNPYFVCSERVVAHCRSLSGIHFYPVEITRCWNKKLKRKEKPLYFWGHFTGRVSVRVLDPSRQEFPRDEKTGEYEFPNVYTKRIYELNLDPSLDFFLMKNVNTAYRFVSERFVRLAEQHRWTNVAFHALTEGNLLDTTIYRPIISFSK
jgi:hypothetical protein